MNRQLCELGITLNLLERCGELHDREPAKALVNQRVHNLQTATRAFNAGASRELVVIALLHDAFRPLSDVFHGEVAAYALREWVSDEGFEILFYHSRFQDAAYRNDPDVISPLTGYEWFETAVELGQWDAASFDPGYRTERLSRFAPHLAHVYRVSHESVLELMGTA